MIWTYAVWLECKGENYQNTMGYDIDNDCDMSSRNMKRLSLRRPIIASSMIALKMLNAQVTSVVHNVSC